MVSNLTLHEGRACHIHHLCRRADRTRRTRSRQLRASRSMGYNVVTLDARADNDALQVGKEYGNRGQCNPTYFTVGNLVKHLIHLRDEKGMSTEDIVKNYVFLTAGACGPCRFGMYVTEYRKALRDAGFDGFRVIMFQQQGGPRAGDRRGQRARAEPRLLSGDGHRRHRHAATSSTPWAIGSAPTRSKPGATDRANLKRPSAPFRRFEKHENIFRALFKRLAKLFAKMKVDKLRLKPRRSPSSASSGR